MASSKNWLSYTWLPVGEAAWLEGISEKVIRNCLRSGGKCRYVWRLNSSGEKEIRLSSLSGDAILRYEDEELPEIEPAQEREEPAMFHGLFHGSPPYAQKKCQQWTEAIRAAIGLRGTSTLRSFVEWWNASKSFKISVPRLYARLKEYRDNGGDRSFLLKERRIPKSAIKDEWLGDFKECYLRQQRPSASDCRIYALGKARMRGENVNEECFPSLASFYRAASKIKDGIKSWHRGGPKKFYDLNSLHVMRDYSALQAGWCWVGDTREWDILVNCPGFDSLKRPYITMFVDMRTDMPMGWHVHFTPPSAANALMALRNGIKHRGKPDMLYVDNGREYRNKDFSGNPRGGNNWGAENGEDGEYWMRSAASILGIQMKFAIAKNPRAKTVENSFGVYKKIIDKSFISYFGGNPVERPEQAKGLFKNKGKAIDFAEFKSIIDRNLLGIIPNYPCESKRFEQGTRKEAWDYLYGQRKPMEILTGEALDMIPTLTEECAVGRNGVTISKLGVSWWAEWMPPIKGDKIIVRYNPQDLAKAWGYDKHGILGEMGRPHIVPAIIEALPEEEQSLAKDALSKAMAAQRRERKLIKNMHRSGGISERDILEAREYALGIKAIDKATGEVIDSGAKTASIPPPAAATKHDTDMRKLRKQSEFGDPELLNMLG